MKCSYRFRSYDLIGVSQIVKIFNDGGFRINSLPEIYLDDDPTPLYRVTNEMNDRPKEEITIDILGVYKFKSYNPECIKRISQKLFTEEGKIILYSKRIEEYAKIHKLNVESVYFVVLIHELGHWFCHWADSNVHYCRDNQFPEWGKKWLLGFNLKNRRTEEALANICVHWILNHKDVLNRISEDFIFEAKKAFDNLTPKKFNGLVNTDNPYGAYYLIKRRKPKVIINKINELRRNWMLCDDEMMAFLRSKTNSIEEFYKNRDLNSQKFLLKIMYRNINPKEDSIYSGSIFFNESEKSASVELGILGLCDIGSLDLSELDI